MTTTGAAVLDDRYFMLSTPKKALNKGGRRLNADTGGRFQERETKRRMLICDAFCNARQQAGGYLNVAAREKMRRYGM
jgi:hypothetical protein